MLDAVGEIAVDDRIHLLEQYAHHCGTVYHAIHGDSNFYTCGETLVCDHSNETYSQTYKSHTLFILESY